MGGLLAIRKNIAADILYVPHHGAEEPVLAEFVRAVAPKIAVISDAQWDTDLSESGSEIEALGNIPTYRTSRDGTITLQATSTGWSLVEPGSQPK